MKYLRNKPVRELKGDEFLKLHLAEQEHLLEMKISIDLEQAQEKRCVGVRARVCVQCTCRKGVCLYNILTNCVKCGRHVVDMSQL